MIVYLLINEKALTALERWRIFTDKNACLAEARKLGYGSSPFGELLSLGDTPGQMLQEMGGPNDVSITMVPIEVEGT